MTIHERAMERASAILFWTAILMFLGGFAMPLLSDLAPISPYGGSSGITPGSFVTAVYYGLSGAILPFTGAGVIWALRRRVTETLE